MKGEFLASKKKRGEKDRAGKLFLKPREFGEKDNISVLVSEKRRRPVGRIDPAEPESHKRK